MFTAAYLKDILMLVLVLVSLGAGTASVLLANKLNRTYGFNYLRSYEYYQVLSIIFGVFGLIGTMLIRRILMDFSIEARLLVTIVQMLPFLSLPFLMAAWYMFIRISAELVNRSLSISFTILFFSIQFVLFLVYGFAILKFTDIVDEDLESITELIKKVMIAMHLITLMISFYLLYFYGRRLKDMVHRKMVLNFAHIFLLIQLTTIILFYLTDKGKFIPAAYLLLYFSGGILPLLYLCRRLKIDTVHGDALTRADINDLFKRHGISKREQEIVDKICAGLTNKQIADALFISLQTVKDHSHNIYKKLGVKNRVQMVNKIKGSDFSTFI